MKYPYPRFIVLAVLAFVSACAVPSDGGLPAMDGGPSYVRLSPSAPPNRPLEVKPFPESPQLEIWRQGYWNYDGSSFSWIAGYYMAKPIPTAAWMPDRWEQRKFGWAFIPGYWN